MFTTTQDAWFEHDFAISFGKVLTILIPTAIVAAIAYGVVMLFTHHILLGIMGILSFSLAPVCWYGKQQLNAQRVHHSLMVFTIATLVILSIAMVLARGFEVVIAAGFSVPLLATALLRRGRVSIIAITMASASYAIGILLAPYLPWQPLNLATVIQQPLILLILVGIFSTIVLLSWHIVGMLQRALGMASTHLESLREANNRQQEIYNNLSEQHNEQQRLLEVIADLEVPIIPLQHDVLLVPLVGSFDSHRAEAARSRILHTTVERRARMVLLDISGIAMLDSAVARQLLTTIQCLQLLGAESLITGMRGEMAQTLVGLGINLAHIRSLASLEDGIGLILGNEASTSFRTNAI